MDLPTHAPSPQCSVGRYADLNPESLAWWQRALNTFAGGGQAHRRTDKYTLRGGPAFAVRGQGAYFWDVDGRRFLDYLMSYGPIILGHADPDVNAAVWRQMQEGSIFSLEHPAVLELGETLCSIIPCAEMTMHLVGGSSATLAAVRCARAHTGRERVVRCGYHGWFDWCFPDDVGAPAQEGALVRAVPYNDLEALAAALDDWRGQTAAVIIEAMQGDGPAPGYFDGVRRLCDAHDVVFILDEVKTGFRLALGGAQELFGIRPDLATFGKAMGNGYPGSVLVGSRRVLGARRDTFIGATFHGDLLSVAAANTVLRILRERDGIGHIARLGRRLMGGLNQVFLAHRYPLRVRGTEAMPELTQTTEQDPERPLPPAFAGKVLTEWCAAMQRRGYYMTGHCWFISLAHTLEDIEHTIAAGDEAADEAWTVLRETAAGLREEIPYL